MDNLTFTQQAILSLIAQGATNREIAEQKAISEKTVKVHVSAIMRALQVPNRTSAALVFHGLPLLARE